MGDQPALPDELDPDIAAAVQVNKGDPVRQNNLLLLQVSRLLKRNMEVVEVPVDAGSLYTYKARVIRWKDGDTAVLDIDKGFYDHVIDPAGIRVYGLDTREIHSTDPAMKVLGLGDLDFARTLVPEGSEVVVRSHKANTTVGKDKYGRWLVDITLPDGRNYTATMIAAGHGVAYFGGVKTLPQ